MERRNEKGEKSCVILRGRSPGRETLTRGKLNWRMENQTVRVISEEKKRTKLEDNFL